jgi:uncharacterized protein (TIGR03435 family)
MSAIPFAPADAIALAANHLWQSTLFAAAAALVAFALRRNRAEVRYWIWLAASVKFLIPFAALVAIGGALPWRPVEVARTSTVAVVMEAVSEPFSQSALTLVAPSREPAAESLAAALPFVLTVIWALGCLAVFAGWAVRWRRMSGVVRHAAPLTSGREMDIVRRLAAANGVRPVPILSSDTPLEPGVFGILRPVLLWPCGISGRLTDRQIEAILAHEICHLRRRDNLAAALHMLVQAVCWFHPLVWWIGARLVDERERACDEEVVRLGSDPEVYAESILETCKFYVESPLACVAGVTGSDLKKRIEGIMTNCAADSLTRPRRLLLVTAAIGVFAAPIALGALDGPPLAAQVRSAGNTAVAFEVASVKPNDATQMRVMQRFLPGGGFEAFNVTLGAVIRLAYRLQDFQVVGEPDWVHTERFDILAKAPDGAEQSEVGLRIQSLLAERFNLRAHMETRDRPIYALTVARADGSLGPQLRPSAADCEAIAAARRGGGPPPAPPRPGERPLCGQTSRPGGISGGGATMAQLAIILARFTGRIVLDRTDLAGGFDFDLEFTPDPPARQGIGLGGGLPIPPGATVGTADPQAVSIFTAVEEQLGLKLEAQTGPVEVLVIEQVERPAAD